MLYSKTSLWPLFLRKSSVCIWRKLSLTASVLGSDGFYCDMIPSWIRKQLFDSSTSPNISVEKIHSRESISKITDFSEAIHKHPAQNMKQCGEAGFQSIGFDLPGLSNRHLSSYFTDAAIKQVDEYCKLLRGLIVPLAPVPQVWLFQPGWTCYKEGYPPQNLEYPDENALILDVEVCVKEGLAPVLATAVSPEAWYCWVSPSLVQNVSQNSSFVHVDNLIPLGKRKNEKHIVVGHFVVYDAVRLKESYSQDVTGLRYFDTMAAHISINGITNLQKFWVTKATSKLPWAKLASGNSLGQLYHLYCGRYLDKSKRNVFVEGCLEDVKDHFQELTTYCAQDVVATHAVFCKLFPLLVERFPNPVTMAAMLEMSCMYVPVSVKWPNVLQEEKKHILEMEREISFLLRQMAQETCELLHNQNYLVHPWMWDQNWSTKDTNKSQKKQICQSSDKEGPETNWKNQILNDNSCEDVSSYVSISEYPEWYQKICVKENSNCPENEELCLTFGMNITPKLLQLCWGPYPLHFLRGHGWGMLVPSSEMSVETKSMPEESVPVESIYNLCTAWPKQDFEISHQNISTLRDNIESCNSNVGGRKRSDFPDSTTEIRLHSGILFKKLPHSQGIGRNVGSPFTKDLINNSALCSRDPRGQRILTLLRRKQFWNKYSKKFESLPLVWSGRSNENAATIPETVVTGDFIRYPKEELLSALCSEEDMTNLSKAMVSQPGWLFLSAKIPELDVWMASLLSDSISGRYGGTPFSEMILSNTYYPSVSNVMGVTEEQSKWLTRAVLFGAQRGFIARMLRQSDPSLSKLKALGRADRLIEYLLGTHTPVQTHSAQHLWQGGLLSELWSKLAIAASKLEVVTPVLNSRLSRVLESDTEKFSALTMSWIIQSSSIDFLHLLLTCFRDLAPSARLSLITSEISIHYLVPEKDKYHAAKSLHLAHLYARAFCASRVGMIDLPLTSAFLPHVQLSGSLKPTKQDKVSKLNFHEAHLLSQRFDCC